jgi:hypothetical protein
MVLNSETEIEMLLFDQERIVIRLKLDYLAWRSLYLIYSTIFNFKTKVSYKELSNKLNIDPAEARKYVFF